MSHGKVSGEERIKRRQRDIDIVALRTQGHTLDAIAKSLDPPISFQRVSQIVANFLDDCAHETVELMRALDGRRIDEMLSAVYERAVNGDLFAIDRVVRLLERRARLYGLDVQPAAAAGVTVRFGSNAEIDEAGRPVVRLIIEGSPEASRKTPLRDEPGQTIEVGTEPQPVTEKPTIN